MEQATHFVDLMRFFAGEILQDTIKAVSVGPQQELTDMPAPPEGEHEVPHSVRLARQLLLQCVLLGCCCMLVLPAASLFAAFLLTFFHMGFAVHKTYGLC